MMSAVRDATGGWRSRSTWLLGAGFVGVGACVFYGRSLPPAVAREWLTRWSGDFLGVAAVLVLVGVILEFASFRESVRRWLPGWRRHLLTFFLLGGALYTALLAPQTHRIFYDETIYLSIGQNLAYLDRAQTCHSGGESHGQFLCDRGEYNKQPNGFPFLTSLVFRVFGLSEPAVFYLNNFLLGCAAVLAMLLVFPVGGGWAAGVFAACVVVFNPQNLQWFNTTAAEPSAAVSAAATVLAACHYRDTQRATALLLLMALAALAVQFRPESFLVLPWVLAIVWRGVRAGPMPFLAGLLLFLMLILPLGVHAGLFHDHPWGSAGKPFGWEYLQPNLFVNGWHYWNNREFPLLFSLLAVAGLLRRDVRLMARGWLAGWFFCFWGVFLFFYAGNYHYGADMRFALLSALPLAVLAGLGAEWLVGALAGHGGINERNGIAVMTALLWAAHVPFMPLARAVTQEAWAARADLRYARLMVERLPHDALILTHNPNFFQVWGLHAAQLSLTRSDPAYLEHLRSSRYPGGLFFHHNFWCNTNDVQQSDLCTTVHQQYVSSLLVEYREKSHRYALYRLEPRKNTPAATGGRE